LEGVLKLETELVRVEALQPCLGKATLPANDDFDRLKQMVMSQSAASCVRIHSLLLVWRLPKQDLAQATTQDWDVPDLVVEDPI